MKKTFHFITESEKEDIVLTAKRTYIKNSMIRCVIGAAILAGLYTMWGLPYLAELIAMGAWFVLGAIALFMVAVVLQYINYMDMLKKWLTKMPNQICVADDGITVGDHTYFYGEIKQIKATPPSYEAKNGNVAKTARVLTITDRNHKKTEFFMGVMLLNGFFARTIITPLLFEKIMFSDYEELCDILRQVLVEIGTAEKFVWDLENF